MNCRSNRQKQLEFMYRVFPVAPPTQTPNFENRLAIQQYGKTDLYVVVVLVKHLSRSFVVFEMHRGRYNAIRQNHPHHQEPEMGGA